MKNDMPYFEYVVLAEVGDELIEIDGGYDSKSEAERCFEYFFDESALKSVLESRGVPDRPIAVHLALYAGDRAMIEDSKEF